MRQIHFCSFLFQTYNHSITVTQAFPVKNTFNLESFFSGIQIIRSHSPFEVVHLHNVRLNIPLKCTGSQAYLRLASEIIQRERLLRADAA